MRTSRLAKFGIFFIDDLVKKAASENGLNATAAQSLLDLAHKAAWSGQLTTRDPDTTVSITGGNLATPCVSIADFNDWLVSTGSLLTGLSTLRAEARNPSVVNSRWEGRTAQDFIAEKAHFGTYTAAAKHHGVSRQRYTTAYNRAVLQTESASVERAQGVAPFTQGVAAVRKKQKKS